MQSDIVFLANTNARKGATGARGARAALEAEGFNVSHFNITNTAKDFAETLREYVANQLPIICVGGGDGTLSQAAEIVANTSSTLAVFPLGTGNAWATDLGIPSGHAAAAKALATAQPQLIDMGYANDRGFVNVATVGLSALIAKNLAAAAKGPFGRWAYIPAVLRSLEELKPFDLQVDANGAVFSGRALQMVAAAGRTHAGPFPVTSTASNQDGLLSLYVLDDTSRAGLLKFAVGLLLGKHTLLGEVWSCETASAKVTTRSPKRIIRDGERAGMTPLRLSVGAGCLSVLVPAAQPDL